MDKQKLFKIVFFALIIAVIVLSILLILSARTEKTRIITVTKTETVKKNIYINRIFDRVTGKLTSEIITDTSITAAQENTKEKDTQKSMNKGYFAQVSYLTTAGTWTAGAGVIIFNSFYFGIENPIILKFEPRIIAGVLF